VIAAAWQTGSSGIVVAIPPPAELPDAEALVERSLREVMATAGDVTPRLLAKIAELSGGRSLDINVDLVVNNARVGARVARAYAGQARR